MSQPPPKKTNTPEVWPLVVDEVRRGVYGMPPYWADRLANAMEARDAFGREKHGEPLRVECGRDALIDSSEEALDLCAYTRQQWEQTRLPSDWDTHVLAVALAGRIQWRIHLRASEEET